MEVGDERLGYFYRARWSDHQSRGGMQGIQMMHVKVFYDGIEAFFC